MAELVRDREPSPSETSRGARNAPEPFDGIAEIWYDNREALETLGKIPRRG
jgi:hypothetical protein